MSEYLFTNEMDSMRDGSKTRALIDRTALKLFTKKGVKETTIKDIAKAAKIAEGTLYRHYKSKDEMAEQLFMEHFVALGKALNDKQKAESTTPAKLSAMIHYFLEAYDRDSTSVNYVFHTRHEYMQRINPRTPNPYMVFRNVIRNGITHGEIPKQNLDIAVSMVMGAILQIIDTRLLSTRLRQKLSGMSDQLTKGCLRLLNV